MCVSVHLGAPAVGYVCACVCTHACMDVCMCVSVHLGAPTVHTSSWECIWYLVLHGQLEVDRDVGM